MTPIGRRYTLVSSQGWRRVKPGLSTAISCAIGAALVAATAGARASELDACLEAHVRGQVQRREGRLLAAHESFAKCARDQCPDAVRSDCASALSELARAIPTVRITVRGPEGEDVDDYALAVDGKVIDAPGDLLELDPGEHELVFSTPDGRVVRRTIVLRPSETGYPVVVELPAPRTDDHRDAASSDVPIAAWVLGGVAVVGLAGFVGFGLAGRSTEECEGSCSEEEIDRLRTQYLLADISLGIALASGGVATYLYVSRPESAASPEEGALIGVGGWF
jgi:hypothetical protein